MFFQGLSETSIVSFKVSDLSMHIIQFPFKFKTKLNFFFVIYIILFIFCFQLLSHLLYFPDSFRLISYLILLNSNKFLIVFFSICPFFWFLIPCYFFSFQNFFVLVLNFLNDHLVICFATVFQQNSKNFPNSCCNNQLFWGMFDRLF